MRMDGWLDGWVADCPEHRNKVPRDEHTSMPSGWCVVVVDDGC